MFDNLKLGFIGFGNMGQAIATGLINQGAIQGNQIFVVLRIGINFVKIHRKNKSILVKVQKKLLIM